ncbi:Rib/alpha-like domain-containing protein [Lactobacillus paragasseri]|uniref:Rib/alpha-like domain-containing protein n=1 Tax=Lactobacillus paragasseri TaxID=2107999 RepID=UPI00254B0946|nr:Rib/alpha-like domain-containing protein [Lactobacillus paragasseri]MDK7121135.1 Rib/alpha-like domain-containing protein [Lactobacillus paragasseri]
MVTGEVTGTGAWEVGKIENNKFVLGGEAEYPTAAVEQISGYDSYVNGTKATEIQSASAVENGKPVDGEAVHITYQQSETPVADVTVSYQFYDTVDKKNVGNPIVVSGKPGVNVKTNLTIPAGYKLAAGQTLPENVVIPAKNEAVVINLVHETKDITPTTPGVNPTDPKYKYKDMFTSVSRKIYQTKPGKAEQLIATQTVNFGRNGVEDLVTGKVTGTGAWEVGKIENNKFVLGGEAEYPTAAVEQISSYDSYVNGTKATEIQSASAIENGKPVDGEAVHITYQKSNTVTPTPYDPNNKDMNKDVVRTITVNKVDGTTETIVQTVHFVRGGEGENVEADTPWTVGVKDGNTWKSTGATEGTWPEYNVPQVTDYTSTVDGKDAKVVLADKNVNANTPNTNVVVAYTKTTTPTDADKYTPEGQDVHTTPGVVPPAEKGIKNKDDMPSGTKYTWEKTPDVTKPGKTTGTVIVTYPDGSKDKVDVPVIIDNPTTPSDADKYTPEGQDVHTTPGVVPPAEKGIKNKDDMPSGTKYTWEKTPDVTKPGKTTGTVIVTYPDGSKDKVNVTVIIGTNHVTPEPQPIHTTPGVVPNPSEGIKNRNDMPEGTKYTWKEVPNVSTIGEHTGVVTVTYPDGSSVDVTVKVYVDATGTSDNNGGKTTETNSETNTAKAATVNENHHAEKNTLPQTGAKSENTAGILGLAIAAVGSLFGLGVDRKKRQK